MRLANRQNLPNVCLCVSIYEVHSVYVVPSATPWDYNLIACIVTEGRLVREYFVGVMCRR